MQNTAVASARTKTIIGLGVCRKFRREYSPVSAVPLTETTWACLEGTAHLIITQVNMYTHDMIIRGHMNIIMLQ